jgi:SpoVK/Ycf46/Vps4 family AAA+-type ATPase
LSTSQQEKLNYTKYSKRYKTNIPIPRDTEKGFPLFEIKEYYDNFDDLILENQSKDRLKYIIDEFKSKDILYTYGLKPKQKILFCGPPGTGKTYSAKIMSPVLNYPTVYVRFDSIVSSFLGERASNLRKIFDFIEDGEWVVLFDEFDIVGKKRDDPYEHGEIKRVVNNFMQMLDDYNGKSLIIASTNHQHLLDTAIWRIPGLKVVKRLYPYLK